MAYSDYGGYAYRNGKHVIERSDAVITPEGDIWSTPGMWPGWILAATGKKEQLEYPSGHVILGDGPIFLVLYKQTDVRLYRGFERLDITEFLEPPGERIKQWKDHKYIDHDYFCNEEVACILQIDDHRIRIFWDESDNYYQYAFLEQPDGTIWSGWSGYGVGVGFDGEYGYSNREREKFIKVLFPEAFNMEND